MPDVTQIDARARGHLRAVSSAVVSERGGQHAVFALVGRFGRELHRLVAVVGEGVGDAPAYVGLLHVGDRLVFEHVRFVEEEAAFKVGKLFKFLARVRQRGAASFDVLLTAAVPSPFGRGENIGVNVVLAHDVRIGLCFRVVPRRADCARHVARALLRVVDVALVNAHEVGVHVKVVRVVVAAVNVGQPAYHATCRRPHLRHVAESACGRPGNEPVPHNNFLAFAAHVVRHRLQEVGISNRHLVAADVDIGGKGECFHHFVEDILQSSHALVALHRKAHGLGEGIAVAGHVNFGNNGHAALCRIGFEILALLLRVVAAGVARHIVSGGELRISLHHKAPGEFLRQVPVEHVYLEARKHIDFVFQFFEGNERASHIVHETAHFEGRPVRDNHSLQRCRAAVVVGARCELQQCLRGTYYARLRHRLDGDFIGGNGERIGFVGHIRHAVVVGAGDNRHALHLHRCCRAFRNGAAHFFEGCAQERRVESVGNAYGSAEREALALCNLHGVGLRQEVVRTCACRQGQQRGSQQHAFQKKLFHDTDVFIRLFEKE